MFRLPPGYFIWYVFFALMLSLLTLTFDLTSGQFFLKESKPVCIECGSKRRCIKCSEIILRGGWDAYAATNLTD